MLALDSKMAKRIHDTATPLVIQVVQRAVREGGFEPAHLHLADDAIVFDPAIRAPSAEPSIVVRAEVKGLVNRKSMFAVVILQTSDHAWVPSHLLFEVGPKHRQVPSFCAGEHRHPIEDADLIAYIATIGTKQN